MSNLGAMLATVSFELNGKPKTVQCVCNKDDSDNKIINIARRVLIRRYGTGLYNQTRNFKLKEKI